MNAQEAKDAGWASLRGFSKGATLGTSKYAGAGARYAFNHGLGGDKSYTWDDALREEADYQRALEDANPKASMVGEFAGTALPAAFTGGAVVPMLAKNAAMGAVQGFTANEGMDNVGADIGLGALLGGAGGAVGKGLEVGATKLMKSRIGAGIKSLKDKGIAALTSPTVRGTVPLSVIKDAVDVNAMPMSTTAFRPVAKPADLNLPDLPAMNEAPPVTVKPTKPKALTSEMSKLPETDLAMIERGNPAEYARLVNEETNAGALNKLNEHAYQKALDSYNEFKSGAWAAREAQLKEAHAAQAAQKAQYNEKLAKWNAEQNLSPEERKAIEAQRTAWAERAAAAEANPASANLQLEDVIANPALYQKALKRAQGKAFSEAQSTAELAGRALPELGYNPNDALSTVYRGLQNVKAADTAAARVAPLRTFAELAPEVAPASYNRYASTGPEAKAELSALARPVLTSLAGLGAQTGVEKMTGSEAPWWVGPAIGAALGGNTTSFKNAARNVISGTAPYLADRATIALGTNPRVVQTALKAPSFAALAGINPAVSNAEPTVYVDRMPWEGATGAPVMPSQPQPDGSIVLPGTFSNQTTTGYQVPVDVQAQRDQEAAQIIQAELDRERDPVARAALQRELDRISPYQPADGSLF